MTMGAVGSTCVDWTFTGMGSLMASWVISPLLAGVIAVIVMYFTDKNILRGRHPRQKILRSIPFFITLITIVMTFLVCVKSEDLKVLFIRIFCRVCVHHCYFYPVMRPPHTCLILHKLNIAAFKPHNSIGNNWRGRIRYTGHIICFVASLGTTEFAYCSESKCLLAWCS